METTGYYAFGMPLYLLLFLVERARIRRQGGATAAFPQIFGNLTAGFGTIVIGLFYGPFLLLIYEFTRRHFALVHWPERAWQPWVLALVLADLGHYLHHRLDHRVAACWAVHGVHHMPEQMDYTTAMRHAWFSDLYSMPFYAPLPLLGVPTESFFLATTLLSFHALITHTEQFNFPGFGILVTPRSHVLHHAKNPRYIDKNFGAMFSVWDRLFGTHVELDPAEPPRYGTLRGYETHDGALAQFVLWKDLILLAREAPTVRGKLRVFFGRPGTSPEGHELPPLEAPPSAAEIAPGTQLYVGVQLAASLAFGAWVCVTRERHPEGFKALVMVAFLVSIVTLGGLLDRRRRATAWEGARLAATTAAFLAWFAR